MHRRPSARLIVIDSLNRMLLFRFVHTAGALAGQIYWAAPGGGVEQNETFTQAALRELKEETGIDTAVIGPLLEEGEFVLQQSSGEFVISVERFFAVRVEICSVCTAGWTQEERSMMTDHRWWSLDELNTTEETVFPGNLTSILLKGLSAI